MNGTPTLLGERIRYFRKASGLSQDELATKAGIAMQYLSRLERGKTNPTVGILSQIALGSVVNYVFLNVILYYSPLKKGGRCKLPIVDTIYPTEFGNSWNLTCQAVPEFEELLPVTIVCLSMLYFGFCVRELLGETCLQTMETGKILIAAFAAGETGANGKDCLKFLSMSLILNG